MLGGSEYVMYAVHLIEFIAPWKERHLGDELEQDAAKTPDVHFFVIVAIGHEALWRPVPACRDVLCVGLLAVSS